MKKWQIWMLSLNESAAVMWIMTRQAIPERPLDTNLPIIN